MSNTKFSYDSRIIYKSDHLHVDDFQNWCCLCQRNGECGSSVSPLLYGYGYVVYGVWYVWGSVGYAQIDNGSFFLLDGVVRAS
jgi:hypothetical protein